MQRRSLPLLGAALATLVLAAACGGDKSGSYNTPNDPELTALATRAIPSPTDASLESFLLSSADLGTGWQQAQLDAAGVTQPDSYYCDVEVETALPDATVVLQNENKRVLFLIQGVAELPSIDEAEQSIEEQQRALAGCDRLLQTDGVRRTEWTVRETDLGDFGDQSVAAVGRSQVDSSQGPLATEAYFVLGRFGRWQGMLAVVWLGDASEEEMLAILQAAEAKLQAISSR